MPEAAVCQRIEAPGKHKDGTEKPAFATFLPLVIVKRRRGPKRQAVQVAMFPGYFFVRFDTAADQWRGIAHATGVRRIFGASPERPIPVPDRAMEWMMARGYDKPIAEDPRPVMFPVGAKLAITRGAWADRSGVCVLSDGKRLEVMMEILGALRRVSVDPAHVVQAV